MTTSIAIIDYGMGNLHSVASALAHADPAATIAITADPSTLLAADRLVFPGVGAIRDCMATIQRLGLDQLIREVAQQKPLLAICVGMQALLTHSEENDGVDCLGLLPGSVLSLANSTALTGSSYKASHMKVPHMGWNRVQVSYDHPLWHNVPPASYFYFANSYYVHADHRAMVAATTEYGVTLDTVLLHGNIVALQFHPEKSGPVGLQLLRNFLRWSGASIQ